MVDFLIVFVSFAGDEQHALVLEQHVARLDGLVAVLDDRDIFLLVLGHAGHHLFQDGVGIFGARVVGCQDDLVAVLAAPPQPTMVMTSFLRSVTSTMVSSTFCKASGVWA